jgi:ParB-like chromosome segregation protein Spo0J
VLAVPDREGQKKLAKRIVEQGLSARAAERAAQDAGAKRKPRKKSAVDPALADRVREAFERATGFQARVGPDQVVVEFRDEHELEELAEALENLTP